VCPEPGCDVELISYENPANRYNPRIFKFKASATSCGHWPALGGGGPESQQHEWMKLRMTQIVRELGYEATAEHRPTNADVFVRGPALCLEVQLRPTQFRKRTAQRKAKGASVCWLIRDGLDSKTAVKALFGLPAVRFRLVDRDAPGRLLAPWDHPEDRELTQRAQLQVFGTVAYAPPWDEKVGSVPRGVRWFRTEPMDGAEFLKQVLAGRRRWYPPMMLGSKRGLWALKTDVARYYRLRVRGMTELT
jgi:hypothetical protein